MVSKQINEKLSIPLSLQVHGYTRSLLERPSYHSSCLAWQWASAPKDGVFWKGFLLTKGPRPPWADDFAISFATSSTCWHRKGSLLCPLTTPKQNNFSVFTSHLHKGSCLQTSFAVHSALSNIPQHLHRGLLYKYEPPVQKRMKR